MLFPSDIIETTFGLKPAEGLLLWDQDNAAHCTHCARPIESGDLYSPSKVGQFFSDSRDLTGGDRTICWRCEYLRKKYMLYSLARVVITKEGVYSIAKDVNKAWFFTSPPPAPFVAVHSSAQMQHLLWRTPVTVDNRLIRLRFGPSLFTIRPEAINRALAICDNMNKGLDQWRSPLILDRDMQKPNVGIVTTTGREMLEHSDIEFLSGLTQGEYWALAYCMHTKRPAPEKPENEKNTILLNLK